MTALSLEARAADQASVDDFEVVYVTEGGAERTLPLTAAWAVAFECGCPMRRFRSRKGSAASERAVVVGDDRRPRGL